MSSTCRGGARQADDYYATPEWAVKAILPCLCEKRPTGVLDPACGNGVLLRAAMEQWAGIEAFGIDVANRGWEGTIVRDALSDAPWPTADVVLANPPYALAAEFVERALREVRAGGVVAFLLRLAWMAGLERSGFHKAHPSDVYVLPRRPSFVRHLKWKVRRCEKRTARQKPCDREQGHVGECLSVGTDSVEYAWFCWGTGEGRWGVLDVDGRVLRVRKGVVA